MSNKSNEIFNAAKRYIELGWCVLPCLNYQKMPGMNWKQYQNRKATLEEWEGWAQNPAVTGICLITGEISGVVAVDLDDPSLKSQFDSTVVSQTRSGGYHFLYKYSDKIKNAVRIDGAPIDFRGDGGLIVLPPSVAEGKDGSKGSYMWLLEPSRDNYNDLPPLPEKARAYLSERSYQRVTASDFSKIQEGQRNTTLYQYACSCIRANDLAIAKTMVEFANSQMSTPLSQREVDTTFNSAKDFILSTPPIQKGLTPPIKRELIKQDTPPKEIKYIDYDDLSDEEIQDIEHCEEKPLGIPKLDEAFGFPAGFYLVCGISNVGKGFFANWVARRMLEQHGLKTVFFSLEMSENLVRERILQSWSDKTQEDYLKTGASKEAIAKLKKGFRVFEFNLHENNQTPEQFKKDFQTFYDKGFRIFMFDHLQEVPDTGSEGNKAVVEKWANTFKELQHSHSDAWLILFVQKRIETEKKPSPVVRMDEVYGSKLVVFKADVILGLGRVIQDKVMTRDFVITVTKDRLSSKTGNIVNLFFAPDGNFYAGESVYQIQQIQNKEAAKNIQQVFEIGD